MNESFRNIKLGLFVIAGTAFLIITLYLIGKKQNLFGDTFHLVAKFDNVNGLMAGNNVRFAGINIGTVDNVEIINDTLVLVDMIIKNGKRKFIKKNAIASLGSDGLMGDKLINITAVPGYGEPVTEGDELQTHQSLEMDEVVRTLNISNENVREISSNLKSITEKLNARNSLWSLLLDTNVAENLKASLVNIKQVSDKSVLIAGDLSGFMRDIKNGKGTLGALITDTTFSSSLKHSMVKIEKITDTTALIVGDVHDIVRNIKQGKGTVGVLLNDTSIAHNLNKTIITIEKGAGSFDENMKAARSSWPFKKYYKKGKNKK